MDLSVYTGLEVNKAKISLENLGYNVVIKNNTNKERITYQAKGTELSTDHYRRLMNQREVYRHPSLPIVVVRTNYNRTIKFIDAIRMVELRIFRGSYPYLVFEGKAIACHKIVAESFNNQLVGDSEDIHHCNLNKNDYNFENLIIIDRKLHKEFHKSIQIS